MTRDTLRKATELNNKIEKLENEKKKLDEIRQKYWGIGSEIKERQFYVTEESEKTGWYISKDSAEATINDEIEMLSSQLREMWKEFKELQ